MPLLELKDVRKRYGSAADGRDALAGVSLTIESGELLAVLGTSGSGKSTLLHVAGGLDADYAGSARLAGHEWRAESDAARSKLRQRHVGFVFQSFHLVPSRDVRGNVALPALFAPARVPDLSQRVDAVLERVGLASRASDRPPQLSGGQRQRVAVARALVLSPELLLCDEPTGALDAETGGQILALFEGLHAAGGLTLVVVTHEERVAAIATRIVRLEAGRIVSDEPGARKRA